jgi:hypothetical protein
MLGLSKYWTGIAIATAFAAVMLPELWRAATTRRARFFRWTVQEGEWPLGFLLVAAFNLAMPMAAFAIALTTP